MNDSLVLLRNDGGSRAARVSSVADVEIKNSRTVMLGSVLMVAGFTRVDVLNVEIDGMHV